MDPVQKNVQRLDLRPLEGRKPRLLDLVIAAEGLDRRAAAALGKPDRNDAPVS